MAVIGERMAPWWGFIAGPLVWWVHQRGIADWAYFECHAGGLTLRVVAWIVAAAVLLLAAFPAWRLWRGWPGRAEPDTRRFLALLSLGMAAIFLLAITFQTLAGVILPECFR